MRTACRELVTAKLTRTPFKLGSTHEISPVFTHSVGRRPLTFLGRKRHGRQSKRSDNSSRARAKLGVQVWKERTEAMLRLQKELLDMCEQASRDWLTRLKSETELWSGLATKLAETRS